MADRFPKDCWKKNCPHFHTRDLSVDDLVCTCDLLKMQCDACDEDWCLYLCPLPNDGHIEEPKAEVIHAKREISSNGYYPYCSHCKTEPKNGVMSKYCPECGAKMDGGKT